MKLGERTPLVEYLPVALEEGMAVTLWPDEVPMVLEALKTLERAKEVLELELGVQKLMEEQYPASDPAHIAQTFKIRRIEQILGIGE